jgi:hypothetical protein
VQCLDAGSGEPYFPTVFDDAGALPQSDGLTRPTLAGRLESRLSYLIVLDTRHMIEDVVAKLVPAKERRATSPSRWLSSHGQPTSTTMLPHWFRDRATIREPMAVRNIGGQHMYKLVTGLIGLALAAVVVVALAGVGSEVKAQLAPVIYQKDRLDAVSSGCAKEPWPYGCQWRAPVKRVFIRGPRAD